MYFQSKESYESGESQVLLEGKIISLHAASLNVNKVES